MSQKIKTSVEIDGSLTASQIANATTDTDKFLVSDGGTVKYRTGAELASDLGIASGSTSKVQHQVKAGVAINKGQAVYVTSADGTNMIVGLASNASEATSSKTMGLLNATVVANGFADVITEGLLDGLNTSAATVGDPVWLGTGGNLIYGLANKPYAPNHLVFIGIVTRVNANNGEIFVKVQNGFELDEIHDVDLKTTAKINGHLLGYNGSLWVNKTIAEWLGYTPYNASNPAGYISSYTETDTLASVTARGASTSTAITLNTGNNIISTATWEKLKLATTGVTAAARQGSDGNGLNFTSNALWNSGWSQDDSTKKSMAYIQHLGNGRHEFRTSVSGGTVSWVTGLTIDEAGANFNVPLSSNSLFSFSAVGNVSFTSNDASSYPRFTGNYASAQIGLFRSGSDAGGMYIGGTSTGFRVFDSSFNTRLLISQNGDTSFSSNVLTVGGNQVWHVGNDGPGSGLDADLLDGQHAYSFAKQAYVNVGYDFNTLAAENSDSAIVYRLESSVTNPPNGSIYNWSLWQQGNSTRGSQIAVGAYGGNEIYFRGANNDSGSYRGWQRVLHDGNYSSYAVPTSRTITINGTSYDLSANRSWTVTASETDTLQTVTSRGATTNVRPSFDSGITVNGLSYVTANGYFVSGAQGFRWNDSSGNYNNVIMRDNGTTWFRNYLETPDSMRSPIYYDYNDTAYYGDFASTSYLRHLSVGDVNAANDGGWNARLNLTGSSHARLDVKSNSDGIITTMYSHTGQGVGKIGTYSNHPLAFMVNTGTAGYAYANYLQGVDSVRAPIFYDSNDTGYYFDGTGGTRQSRYLTISGGGTGNYGNELVVGNTSVQYSLQDTNLRSIIQATGAYPVLSLNHTVTSNGSHGGTVQFTSNGVGNQFVIGSSGNGSRLDIGTSSSSNWNPHNGIDNYSGTTGWRMDTSGNVYNLVSNRSPIYYDYNDTGYYWNPATDASHRFQTPYGYIDIGPKNTSYCHIYTDRGSFYFNAQLDVLGNRVLNAGNYSNYAWPLEGGWKPASLASSTRLRGATSPDGGEFGLAYSGGQIHPYADGFFYQNEGAYRVMDSNSIGDYTVGNYRTIADYSSDSTWYMRPNGRFVFANAHDWTQTFELLLPSGGSNNNTFAQFGQRQSNATNGNLRGLSIRRYINGVNDLGDLQAGNIYGRAFYDDDNNGYFLDLSSTGKSAKIGGYLETYASANKAVLVGNWNGANYWGFGSDGAHTMKIDMVSVDSSAFMGATDVNLMLGNRTVLHTSNYSSYALPISGGSMTGQIYTPTAGTGVYDGAIQIRETGYVGTAQYDWGYAPAMTFHWGNRFVKKFGARSDGAFAVDDVPIVLANGGTWSINISGNASTVGNATVNTLRGNVGANPVNFTVNGDANTYYPVIISPGGQYGFNRYSIYRGYAEAAPWDPIGTGSHKGGLTFTFDWSSDIAWGGNDKAYRVIEFQENYTTMVAGMTLPVTGGMIVWLRGGGAAYHLQGPAGINHDISVYYSGYTAANGSFFGTRTNLASVDGEIMARYPIRGNGDGPMYINNSKVLYEGSWINNKYFGTDGNIYAAKFSDSDDGNYYVEPGALSKLWNLELIGSKHTYLYINPGTGYEAMLRVQGGSGSSWYAGKRTTGTTQAGTDGFHFYSDAGGDTVVGFGTDGTIRGKGDVVAYSSSDRQLKDNVTPIKNALEKVNKIGGYTFDWNDKQNIYEGHDVGVIAQEIEKVLPEVVTTRDTGFKAVKYEKIVPLLIEAIKEQQTQIEELKQLVNQLINK